MDQRLGIFTLISIVGMFVGLIIWVVSFLIIHLGFWPVFRVVGSIALFFLMAYELAIYLDRRVNGQS